MKATTMLLACLATLPLFSGCFGPQPRPSQVPVETRIAGPGNDPSGTPVEIPGNDAVSLAPGHAGDTGRRADLPAALRDRSGPLAQRSIHFDLDQFDIKSEYTALLGAHAELLSRHRNLRLRLEGNTDERGTTEYNNGLGNRRANAVKGALLSLGAKDEQLESISFGELQPKDAGHDEAAWARNRRVDLRYEGE